MRVCIDIQSVVPRLSGVGRYAGMLARRLPACAGTDSVVLFRFDFMGKGARFAVAGAENRTVRWMPGRAARAAWKIAHWPAFETFAGEADVYHFPNFFLPPLSGGRSVVTIHDLAFMRFPETIEEKNLRHLRAEMPETVRRADAIIAVSRHGAAEIVSLLNADPAKVHAVHEGISPDFAPAAESEVRAVTAALGLDGPYLLAVGTIEPRKNLEFLVEVFERMEDFDGRLAIVGGLGWKYQAILARMRDSRRAGDIRILDHVADSQLRALYTGSALFVFPSLYEGFGFPPLEAMACGAPVLASDAGSLPEVLGDAAAIVHSFDAEEWAHRACELAGDRSGAERGRAHAARYSWDETARRTWDVYRKVRS